MTYDEIKPYIEKGLVSEQRHPECGDIVVLNYTQETQFSGAWDEVTRQCRGLIMNIATGEILARPFPKFFNYAEHVAKGWPIPSSLPMVSEKLDGSLGILYILNDKPWIATRGSFTSDQAIWATEWYRKNIEGGDNIEPGITNLFEIVYPSNRIVVAYDFSGLVHLASIENTTGKQVDVFWDHPIRKPKKYDVTDLSVLSAMDESNSEGFVVFFPQENVRMKIKFPEYVRLHKIVTGLSSIGIWEALSRGEELRLESIPDELFQWIQGVQEDLCQQYHAIESEAQEQFERIVITVPETRKEWAERIKEMTHPNIGFSMLDGKDYGKMIWKIVRPRGGAVYKHDIDSGLLK